MDQSRTIGADIAEAGQEYGGSVFLHVIKNAYKERGRAILYEHFQNSMISL